MKKDFQFPLLMDGKHKDGETTGDVIGKSKVKADIKVHPHEDGPEVKIGNIEVLSESGNCWATASDALQDEFTDWFVNGGGRTHHDEFMTQWEDTTYCARTSLYDIYKRGVEAGRSENTEAYDRGYTDGHVAMGGVSKEALAFCKDHDDKPWAFSDRHGERQEFNSLAALFSGYMEEIKAIDDSLVLTDVWGKNLEYVREAFATYEGPFNALESAYTAHPAWSNASRKETRRECLASQIENRNTAAMKGNPDASTWHLLTVTEYKRLQSGRLEDQARRDGPDDSASENDADDEAISESRMYTLRVPCSATGNTKNITYESRFHLKKQLIVYLKTRQTMENVVNLWLENWEILQQFRAEEYGSFYADIEQAKNCRIAFFEGVAQGKATQEAEE